MSYNLSTTPIENPETHGAVIYFYEGSEAIVSQYLDESIDSLAGRFCERYEGLGCLVGISRQEHGVTDVMAPSGKSVKRQIEGVSIHFSAEEVFVRHTPLSTAQVFYDVIKQCERAFQFEQNGREVDLEELRTNVDKLLG